jgi:hypothetical protein
MTEVPATDHAANGVENMRERVNRSRQIGGAGAADVLGSGQAASSVVGSPTAFAIVAASRNVGER